MRNMQKNETGCYIMSPDIKKFYEGIKQIAWSFC